MESEKDQINLNELIQTLWIKRFLIVAVSSFFAIFSIFYSLNLPNVYQSQIILTISDNQMSTSQSSSSYSNIASSFGIDLGSTRVNTDKVAVSIMNSWGFADDLIKENSLEPMLVASIGWDKTENKLIYDKDIYNDENKIWSQEPTSWKLYQNLKSVINIRYDTQDKFIYLSADSFSPYIAKDLVEMYVSSINEYMRVRQISQSNKNLTYLEAQLDKIKNNTLKQIFYDLILQENKSKMLAEANPEYMFVVVSRAMVPEVKNKPVRSIIVISITVIGFLIACLFVLIQNNI